MQTFHEKQPFVSLNISLKMVLKPPTID